MLGDGRDYLLSRLELHKRALLQVCRLGEKFSSLSSLLFFSRSTRYPAKGMYALVEGVLLDRRGENEDRVQPPSISNRLQLK